MQHCCKNEYLYYINESGECKEGEIAPKIGLNNDTLSVDYFPKKL